jgi:hypothetical protein
MNTEKKRNRLARIARSLREHAQRSRARSSPDPTIGASQPVARRPRARWLAAGLVVGLVAALSSCQVEPSVPPTVDAKPALTEYSTHYLDAPAREVAQAISAARSSLQDTSPDLHAVGVSLEHAAAITRELTDYYLPVTAARDHLIIAYEAHIRGDPDRRDAQLSAAEEQLTWVVEHSPRATSEYAAELLTLLTSIELHKNTSTDLADSLESLCQSVQTHLLKAPLVLRGNEAETP